MIIFLYGPDSYCRNEKLRELIAAYKTKHREIDFLSLDLADSPEDWFKARDFLNQPSLFLEAKVLVVKESGTVEEKDWPKTVKAELGTPKTFVLISDTAKPKKPFQFLLKKPVQYQAFQEPAGVKLNNFLKKESEARGLVFKAEAWSRFCKHIENNSEKSWFGVKELEKIALANFRKPIVLADLNQAIEAPVSEFSSWKTKNLFSEEGPAKKLFFLEDLFLTKEDAAHVFNLLAYQTSGQSAVRLADYDISIKSGGLDYETALLAFVLNS